MLLHPKIPSSVASFKSRMILPFWYRLTQVVLEKRPFNGCSSSSSRIPVTLSVITKHKQGNGGYRTSSWSYQIPAAGWRVTLSIGLRPVRVHIAMSLEDDRASVIGNLHRKFGGLDVQFFLDTHTNKYYTKPTGQRNGCIPFRRHRGDALFYSEFIWDPTISVNCFRHLLKTS